jgi:basic amino acid/polyamine antiporter, APA family
LLLQAACRLEAIEINPKLANASMRLCASYEDKGDSDRAIAIDILGEMVSIGTLFAFVLVCGAVIYLRSSDAEVARPFRTPGVPAVPILGIAFSVLLMVFLPWQTWLRLIVWLVIGLAVYFVYGRSHSVLLNGAAPR